jgi:hypothetical protein
MRVALVALGHSCTNYMELAFGAGGRKRIWDETWGVNAAGDVIQCERIFHMDDMRIQEARAAAGNEKVKAMLEWMKTTQTPIMTSRAYDTYPSLVEYPLEEIVNSLGSNYFNNTVPYAIAFAIHYGVKHLFLYGVDYSYPNIMDAERGRGCCEYWIRAAQERGCEVSIGMGSTILDGMVGHEYGYDTEILKWQQEDGRLKLTRTDRETIPTAAEIEARYDHRNLAREAGLLTLES